MPHGAKVEMPTGREQYAGGHIPGAIHLDYAEDLHDLATPYAARIAPPERFAEVMGANGIGDGTLVDRLRRRRRALRRAHGLDAALLRSRRRRRFSPAACRRGSAGGRPLSTETPSFRARRSRRANGRRCARRAKTCSRLPKAAAACNCSKRSATIPTRCATATFRTRIRFSASEAARRCKRRPPRTAESKLDAMISAAGLDKTNARSSRAAAASAHRAPISRYSKRASPTSPSTTAPGWNGATTSSRPYRSRGHARSLSRASSRDNRRRRVERDVARGVMRTNGDCSASLAIGPYAGGRARWCAPRRRPG